MWAAGGIGIMGAVMAMAAGRRRHAGNPMRYLFVRTFGLLLLLFAAALLPPILVSLIYGDGAAMHFATMLLASLALGAWLTWGAPAGEHIFRTRDGFLIVTLMWVGMSLIGSIPFMVLLGLSPPEAVFESASGFTTTGSTVIVGLDVLPPSVLFYRQEIQWLGGIGVVVLAIALLPILGMGGMQLLKAETPGPVKEDKLRPRLRKTARLLSGLYLSITAACALFYWLAGMPVFDAIAHSFSTVSTGGFSTHDASLAYFDSPAIEMVAVIFMLIGATSFAVHFRAWDGGSLKPYLQSIEVRTFLLLVAFVTVAVAITLWVTGTEPGAAHSLRFALFEVVSVITSTGYGIADFAVWPLMLPVLMIFLSFIGGCSSSTAGGMKVLRFVIIGGEAAIEVLKLIHPRMIRPLKVDGRSVPEHVVRGVWAFFAVYVLVFGALMLVMMLLGLDQVTAFGAVATCLNNLGPGLGETALNFTTVPDAGKWLLALATIMGRLEIFTIFVLLTPAYWRA